MVTTLCVKWQAGGMVLWAVGDINGGQLREFALRWTYASESSAVMII